jgi:hypothetical protein
MKTPYRALCLAMLLSTAPVLTSCSTADADHFWGRDAQPGYTGPSDYYRNGRTPVPYQAPAPDPFYAQQNAAREANMKAVREQQYKNEMQNYKNGYRSTLPNY